MKKIIFIIFLLWPVTSQAEDAMTAYYDSVDYSCSIDVDCVVKNIGNCCGYYPECVNKNAVVDPEKLENICKELQIGSICGFPVIEQCGCVNDRCANTTPVATDTQKNTNAE